MMSAFAFSTPRLDLCAALNSTFELHDAQVTCTMPAATFQRRSQTKQKQLLLIILASPIIVMSCSKVRGAAVALGRSSRLAFAGTTLGTRGGCALSLCPGFLSQLCSQTSTANRFMHSTPRTSLVCSMTIEDTPLGKSQSEAGHALLDGLDVYTVPASGDGHPMTVYGIDCGDEEEGSFYGTRKPVLMLHGRTWSSVPVYHLLGGPKNAAAAVPGKESRSLMETLRDAGLQPYAMDFRGFGGTPKDDHGWVEPNRCVADVESVLKFIAERHPDPGSGGQSGMPALMGWSQGALVAQLVAQKSPDLMSKLILYGSIYDPLIRYPPSPLYAKNVDLRNETAVENTFDGAIEDFTIEGSIPSEPARLFAEAALLADPFTAQWKNLHQFNICDPARVNVPTLVIAGDQDPYAPLRVQTDLFCNLGRGADRCWKIIADADHAVHLLDGRDRFVATFKSFVDNAKKGGVDHYH